MVPLTFQRFVFAMALMMLSGLSAFGESKKENCSIRIEFTFKSGEKKTEEFSSQEKSKRACADAAKLHEHNFAPHAVKKKVVTFEWKEKK